MIPMNIAHMGFSAKYPENTILSFQKALEAGADGIGIDVRMSRDGELVILKSVFDGDEEFLEAIEDEAEFDEIAAIFMERLQDDYEFTGGDEESL